MSLLKVLRRYYMYWIRSVNSVVTDSDTFVDLNGMNFGKVWAPPLFPPHYNCTQTTKSSFSGVLPPLKFFFLPTISTLKVFGLFPLPFHHFTISSPTTINTINVRTVFSHNRWEFQSFYILIFHCRLFLLQSRKSAVISTEPHQPSSIPVFSNFKLLCLRFKKQFSP